MCSLVIFLISGGILFRSIGALMWNDGFLCIWIYSWYLECIQGNFVLYSGFDRKPMKFLINRCDMAYSIPPAQRFMPWMIHNTRYHPSMSPCECTPWILSYIKKPKKWNAICDYGPLKLKVSWSLIFWEVKSRIFSGIFSMIFDFSGV